MKKFIDEWKEPLVKSHHVSELSRSSSGIARVAAVRHLNIKIKNNNNIFFYKFELYLS